jgi:hypothetical protein
MQLFLFGPIPAKAKKLGLLSIYKFSLLYTMHCKATATTGLHQKDKFTGSKLQKLGKNLGGGGIQKQVQYSFFSVSDLH